jgi:hypothetical protein
VSEKGRMGDIYIGILMEVALFLTCRQFKDLRRAAENESVHILRQEIAQTSVPEGKPARLLLQDNVTT